MLELKKKELELMKVSCAKAEMEMKVYEAQENIIRLQANMTIQDERIETLKVDINELKTN